MFLKPKQHMLLPPANIFVAVAHLGISGPFPQLASEAIKYGHIVSSFCYIEDGSKTRRKLRQKRAEKTPRFFFVLTAQRWSVW